MLVPARNRVKFYHNAWYAPGHGDPHAERMDLRCVSKACPDRPICVADSKPAPNFAIFAQRFSVSRRTYHSLISLYRSRLIRLNHATTIFEHCFGCEIGPLKAPAAAYGQSRFGSFAAVWKRRLGALLVIDHDIDRDARGIGPFRGRRRPPIPDKVSLASGRAHLIPMESRRRRHAVEVKLTLLAEACSARHSTATRCPNWCGRCRPGQMRLEVPGRFERSLIVPTRRHGLLFILEAAVTGIDSSPRLDAEVDSLGGVEAPVGQRILDLAARDCGAACSRIEAEASDRSALPARSSRRTGALPRPEERRGF
jgi:hypothetical protein